MVRKGGVMMHVAAVDEAYRSLGRQQQATPSMLAGSALSLRACTASEVSSQMPGTATQPAWHGIVCQGLHCLSC